MRLEKEIGGLLRRYGLTIAVAESASGGLLSHRLTGVPGSSQYFLGAVVAYDDRVKRELLGVKRETLSSFGAVSAETAQDMAQGVRGKVKADIGLADTGIAGPAGATPGKPVGLVYVALASGRGTRNQRHIFSGDREENKHSFSQAALTLLQEYLLELGRFEEKHVVTCFLEHEGKLLLLRRSEQVGTYEGRWAAVSGYVETSPDEQALVEIEEETGLSGANVELMQKGEPLEAIDEELERRWVVHPYRFRVSTPEKLRIDWEHQEARWIEPRDMARFETVPRLRETLERVRPPE